MTWCRQNEAVKQIQDVCFSLIDALTLNSDLNYQCKNCFCGPLKVRMNQSQADQLLFNLYSWVIQGQAL